MRHSTKTRLVKDLICPTRLRRSLDIGMTSDQNPVSDISQMTSLAEISRRHALVRPDSVALSFEGRETTFALFHRHSNQVANALIAAAVTPGQRVAYLG